MTNSVPEGMRADMDLGRLSSGQRIVSISALLLFILMFFDWFGTKSSDASLGLFSVGRSAWEALDYIPIVLLITIATALTLSALRLTSLNGKASRAGNTVVAILGFSSALLILFRVIDPPSFGYFGTPFGPITYEGTVQLPMFLALLAALGIALGAFWAMRDKDLSEA